MIDNLDITEKLDFIVRKNTTFYREIEFEEDGEPLPIADYNFVMQIKSVAGGEALLEFSEAEGTLTKSTNSFTLEAEITLNAGVYYCDLLVTYQSKKIYWTEGTFTVNQNITEVSV